MFDIRLIPFENLAVNYVVETSQSDEKRHYVHRYVVEGRGEFPFDMLRYDRSHPKDSDDAFNITNRDFRKVTLIHISANPNWVPTFDRWRSFGWYVKTDA